MVTGIALRQRSTNLCARIVLAVAALATLLAACSGSTGPQGPAGPAGATGATGPQGPGAGVAAIDVTTATAITGTIKSVTVGGPPVVQFSLVDENGVPLKGLPAADIGWAIAKLTPGVDGESSTWQSYIYHTVTPSGCPTGVPACLSKPATQPTVESGTSGTLVDNGNGTYQYTFQTDITNVANVTYDASLTHRVGFEIRGLAPANNGSYTFQPSTGATTGIFMREIIELSTCNGCHTKLALHGGARVETQYCVICHNPSNSDPYSGNTLDFKRMIHKIHQGNSLPSIQTPPGPALTGSAELHPGSDTTPTLGQGYWIIGYMESLNNFNTILFPQDTRNCATSCHLQNLPAATQAANYSTVPTIEACGACHDNVNFATGLNHPGGAYQNDAACATCHVNSEQLPQLTVQAVHVIPDEVEATHFQFIINSVAVTGTAPTIYPVVNFSVVDPTNDNAPYNILTSAPFVGTDPATGLPVCADGKARLAIDIAWETSDYTNWGSGPTTGPTAASTWGQPISFNPLAGAGCTAGAVTPVQQANGSFTVTSPTPLPAPPPVNCPPAGTTACAPIANFSAVLEGHPGVVTTGPGADSIPVTSAVAYGNVSGATPVPRRVVVDIAKCDVCHYRLELHGSNRNNNVQVCVNCHNPASTDVGQRQGLTAPGVDGLWEQSINARFLYHFIHSGSVRAAAGLPPVIYGFNASINNFENVVFPGQLNDCAMCHNSGTYYPVNDSTVQATTFDTGLSKNPADPATPGNPISTSANMAVCEACHFDSLTMSHMMQNGGSTAVTKDAEGRTASNPTNAVETCTLCHGQGAIADVAVVHNIPVADR